jgi:DNA-directed RNA polymerase subunit E'/Rpb7
MSSDSETNSLTEQGSLYSKQCVHKKISIPFSKLQPNAEEQFVSYAKKHLLNQCTKEGYISNRPFHVVSYSAGKTNSHYIDFDVVFEFQICFPYEGMMLRCSIESITKIGIKAVLSKDETENPIVVFASHLHNPTIFDHEEMDDGTENASNRFEEGQVIQVKVLGHRFEINDPSIYVLGEIVV